MTEITRKIESIRNMTEDLNSIKRISQKTTEKMFQDLADFRNRITHEMSKIENIHRSGRNPKRKDDRKLDERQRSPSTQSVWNEMSQYQDSEQMNFIMNEIKNVQKKSQEMLIEMKDNYSEPLTDRSTSLSSMHTMYTGSQNKENLLSANTMARISVPDGMNTPYSTQLPNNTSELTNIPSTSGQAKAQLKTENNLENGNEDLTKERVDKLTKKLKEIQTQNDELRNVNENIQNLLVKLSDLKYVDVETVEKLETVRKESQMSDLTYLPQINSDTVLKNENYKEFTRSVEITSKCCIVFTHWLLARSCKIEFISDKKSRGNMLTKIQVAKLIIKRIRDCSNIAQEEHKYKVRVRQAEQSITLKAHHNKRQ